MTQVTNTNTINCQLPKHASKHDTTCHHPPINIHTHINTTWAEEQAVWSPTSRPVLAPDNRQTEQYLTRNMNASATYLRSECSAHLVVAGSVIYSPPPTPKWVFLHSSIALNSQQFTYFVLKTSLDHRLRVSSWIKRQSSFRTMAKLSFPYLLNYNIFFK